MRYQLGSDQIPQAWFNVASHLPVPLALPC